MSEVHLGNQTWKDIIRRMGAVEGAVPYLVIFLTVAIVARLIWLYGQVERERRIKKATLFAAPLTASLLACGVALCLCFGGVIFKSSNSEFTAWNGIQLLALPLLVGYVWLGSPIIILDDWGITEKNLARPPKHMPYSEIRNLCRVSDKEFHIYGTGRVRKIVMFREQVEGR